MRLLSLTEKLTKRRQELEKKSGKKKKVGKTFADSLSKAEKFKSMEDHRIPIDQLYEKLETSPAGLTNAEAKKRIETYGHNRLTEKKKTPWYVQFIHEITNFFSLLLWAGAGLSFLAYGLDESDPSNLYLGVAIAIVTLATGIMTFVQNRKSEAIMEGFKNFIPPKAMCQRDGKQMELDAIDLVPGDIIDIPTGMKIPADIRIIDSRDMRVDNSSLTGESEPLIRSTECTNKENPLETKNLAFFGTFCKQGSGTGIVIFTGDSTVIGQIANLASTASSGEKSPLRKELDKFIFMISTIAISLGIVFFCLGFILAYPPITNLIFAIGIIVANVPEGLLGTLTLCLAITAKRLSEKQVLVKNLESVETLGSTTCICSDKTGTLTKNQMTVERVWYDGKLRLAQNIQTAKKNNYQLEYSFEKDATFRDLLYCAAINSEEVFTTTVPDSRLEKFKKLHPHEFEQKRIQIQKAFEEELKTTDFIDRLTTGGNASEAALIKFFQPIKDITDIRNNFQAVKLADGNITKIPFNSMNKYSLIIVENITPNSFYTLYTKGAPERVWKNCSQIAIGDTTQSINMDWDIKFEEVNNECGKAGERVLAFSKLDLPKSSFPQDFKFNMMNYNFPFEKQTFVGLISLIDPPRDAVPFAVIKCKTAGIKVIMVTGDQPVTAASIARKVNIITEAETANEIAEREGISLHEAMKKSNAIVIHGDLLTRMINDEEGMPESEQGKRLEEWLLKDQIVFARTSPAQKLIIVKACQKIGHIVAVTGDGVNDSPAIKKADIGVAMGIAGTDVAKDAADMVLLTDDFSAIVVGVEEGRKIFDNLKKTCAYVLTSNIPEIFPFISLIVLRIPIPLSTILILCVDLGTDVFPSMAYAYEEAELDIMVRVPRKQHQHLVNAKMMVFSYLQMGFIQSFAGYLTYVIVMNDFGFPFYSVLNIITDEGVSNKKGDIFDPTAFNLGNSNLGQNGAILGGKSKAILDWMFYNDIDTDARMFYVNWDNNVKKWVPFRTFGECRVHKHSPVSDRDVCFSTEALKYAQTAFFFSIVLCQYNNALACKTRKLSMVTNGLKNRFLIYGYILEACIMFFLAWVPPIQYGFGTRDVIFIHWGTPALPFSIFQVIWEETRKYLINNFPSPKDVPGKPNWFERNTLW